MSIFVTVDDKHVPLYRIVWVSELPHFCGEEDCTREGQYEIRLEQGESVWGSLAQRDEVLSAMEKWQGGMDQPDEEWEQ